MAKRHVAQLVRHHVIGGGEPVPIGHFGAVPEGVRHRVGEVHAGGCAATVVPDAVRQVQQRPLVEKEVAVKAGQRRWAEALDAVREEIGRERRESSRMRAVVIRVTLS